MLGTKVTLRLAGGAPQVYVRACTFVRPAGQLRARVVSPKFAFAFQRGYATPGRPKGAVGEPTRTVKRAVKRTASEKKPATAAKPKSKTATPKTTKPKTAKPKKVKAPKVLTEAQQERAAARAQRTTARLQRAEIKELKVLALPVPKELKGRRHTNSWAIFAGEKTKEALSGNAAGDATASKGRMGAQAKENAAAYKALSPAEREHYNHLANERNLLKTKNFKAWLETHTPDQIRVANQARRKLRNKLEPAKAKAWTPLEDDRLVKRPIAPYSAFFRERVLSGDFRHIDIVKEGSKLIAKEWNALTNDERSKYNEIAKEDTERYNKEHLEVYGHPAATA